MESWVRVIYLARISWVLFILQLVQSHFPHIFLVIRMTSKSPLTLHVQKMSETILCCDANWSHANGSCDALKEVLSHVSKKFSYSTSALRSGFFSRFSHSNLNDHTNAK